MNLEIIDQNDRMRKDMIKTYNFVQYQDDFSGEGNFAIIMPTTEESLQHLVYGNFIFFELGVVGIIKSISDAEDGGTEIKVSGKLTNHVLSFRSFLKTTTYYDTLANNARKMVSDLFIDNIDSARNINFVKLSADDAYIPNSEKVRVQNTGNRLLDVLTEMFLPYGFGYELYPIIADYNETVEQSVNLDKLEFRVLKPIDRTINNTEGNIPVVFSFELSNLKRIEYSEDGSAYHSVAVVASEGTGQGRKTLEVGDVSKVGYERIELYVDARDIQSEDVDGNIILSDAELEELMRQRGLEKLEEHKKFVSFDGSIVEGNIKYTYKKDFYKGDYVSIVSKELGKTFNLQIVAVSKSVSNGVEYFDMTFGYDRMKINSMAPKSSGGGIVASSGGSGGGGTGEATTVTVKVASTTTGLPGSKANVTNSGDDVNVKLNFTIPAGTQGVQGDKGSAATITVGTVSTVDSTQEASVTNVGTDSNAVFNFEIPRGPSGAVGLEEVKQQLGGFAFGYDTNGKAGYKEPGATEFIAFGVGGGGSSVIRGALIEGSMQYMPEFAVGNISTTVAFDKADVTV